MYSDKVMDHFFNPRNVGMIPDADGVGIAGNPVCGDLLKLFIKVKDDAIEDIKFQTLGCGAAIATSSMVTEMVKGKTLEEAKTVTNQAVAQALGGLPPVKMHCSNLAADAVQKAIEDYEGKRGIKKSRESLFEGQGTEAGVRGGRESEAYSEHHHEIPEEED
ncbi:MAG: Fe-S cluster assembly scaffold protein NifU [Chloroflexi bacterium]|nr:Fe-S cluster assembly scaffold protein NifU [Chloroflexota bacterium]